MSSISSDQHSSVLGTIRDFRAKYSQRLDGMVFGCVSAALVLLAGVFVVRSEPRPEVELRLADGAAWLPSQSIGGVSLLDGSDGSIATSLGVADHGDDFSVVQWGSDAIVINNSAGTVSRLDGASWTVATGRVQFGLPGEALDIVVDDSAGWLLQDGVASPLDLETLEQRSGMSVPGLAFDAAVAENGSLLYSSDDADSPVRRLAADARSSSNISGLTGRVALEDLGGMIAGVDLDEETVWLEGKGVVCEDLGLSQAGAVTAAGADGMLLVLSQEGNLAFWAGDSCPQTKEMSTIGSGSYGTPVVTQGWAVVPDIGRNELIVIDSQNGLSGTRISLGDMSTQTTSASAGSLQLVAETGAIWYNDPNSPAAGLILRQGQMIPITKYDDESDSGFVAAPDDQSPDTDLALAASQEVPEELSPKGPTLEEEPADADQLLPDEFSGPSATVPDSPRQDIPSSQPASGGPDPLGPVLSQPVDGGDPTQPTVTTPDSAPTTPAVTVVPTIDVQLASTATEVRSGGTISFQAITRIGSPQFYEFTVSPNTGSRTSGTSSDRFSYSFTTTGTYFVSVRACDADGACDRETIAVTVLPSGGTIELVAAFASPSNIIVDQSVQFQDASQGTPENWEWSFPDGSPGSSTKANPTVRFESAGTKTIKLKVTSADGRTATTEVEVEVVDQQPPLTLNLNGDTSVESGSTGSYSLLGPVGVLLTDTHWQADGGTVTVTNSGAQVVWATQGSYVVRATANAAGQTLSASLQVNVSAPTVNPSAPTVALSGPDQLSVGEAGTFVATNSGGPVDSYSWSSDGQSQSSAASVTYVFVTPGTYKVGVTLTGPGGEDYSELYVDVQSPTPQAAPFAMSCDTTSLPAGESSTCTLQGDTADFANINWSVAWPDPALANSWSNGDSEFHIGYLGGGSVVVTLSAQDLATGETRSLSVTLNYEDPIIPAPSIVVAGPEAVVAGSQATFTVQNSGGQIDSLAWSSAGQVSGSGASYTLNWDEPGTYEVAVRTEGPGGSDAATISVTVSQPAPPSFSLTCPTPVNVGNISYCQLVGDAAKFSGFSWSVAWPDASLSESWNGEAWTMNIGYQAAASFGVTLQATDTATGVLVSASATVTFE